MNEWYFEFLYLNVRMKEGYLFVVFLTCAGCLETATVANGDRESEVGREIPGVVIAE